MAKTITKKKREEEEPTTVGRPKKESGQTFQVNSFSEEMAALAAKQKKAEAINNISSISTKGGRFTINGQVVKSDSFQAVVVASAFSNVYYTGAYDPQSAQAPYCYAFGQEEDELAPHENAADPQCEDCENCPLNVFGSADNGVGKACKNQRRLALIMEGDMKDKQAPIYVLNVSVTSVKNWKTYVQSVIDAQNRPVQGVLTEITIHIPKGQTHGVMEFEFVEELSDKELAVVFPRRDEAYKLITQPFPKTEEDSGKKGGKKGGRGDAPFKGGKFTKQGREERSSRSSREEEAPARKKAKPGKFRR